MTIGISTVRTFVTIYLACFMFVTVAFAAGDEQLQCARKAGNIERLECYDALNAVRLQGSKSPQEAEPAGVAAPVVRSFLTRSWDLDNKDEGLLGESQSPLKPHRVSYMIARRTSVANLLPHSPKHAAATSPADIELYELKFQISQKAKVLNPLITEFLGFTSFRLWGAYTQQSNWQAFNINNSSPFRETNYEPELILTASTGNQYGLKLVNLGYVHQSNGRDLSGSRSWNRAYLQGGWENDTLSALLRGWWRIPENTKEDDNPDIEDYMGRAEIVVRWQPLDGSQLIGLTLRNNLRLQQSRSFMQLDWATPISVSKSTKLHIQLTSGYGESLIDYNFRQTTFGLGVSFRDW